MRRIFRETELGLALIAHGAIADDNVDYGAAITAALATGRPVILGRGTFNTTTPVIVPAGGELRSLDDAVIHYEGGATGIGVVQTSGAGAKIKGIIVDGGRNDVVPTAFGNYGVWVQHDDCIIEDVEVRSAAQRGIYLQSCARPKVRRCKVNGGDGTGMAVYGVSAGEFVDNDLSNNAQFACHVDQGTNTSLFRGNRCNGSGLELIGMTYSCWGNRVEGNHAEDTGDNGISITGFDNIIVGNICRGNYHCGIGLYGHRNVVTGNHCLNNDQRFTVDGTSFPGILVQPVSGGLASENTIIGNICSDTQAVPTQEYGVKMMNSGYTAWAQGQAVTVGTFRTSSVRLYVATTAGTTGAVAPTHTTGAVSDGGVTWQFVVTADTDFNSKSNVVDGCIAEGNRSGIISSSSGSFNRIILDGAGSPEGQIVAPPGSIYIRNNPGTGGGTTVYLKTQNAGAASGWAPLIERLSGTTGNRPPASSGKQGIMYYDTTLNKPVWINAAGSGYVDATGAAV